MGEEGQKDAANHYERDTEGEDEGEERQGILGEHKDYDPRNVLLVEYCEVNMHPQGGPNDNSETRPIVLSSTLSPYLVHRLLAHKALPECHGPAAWRQGWHKCRRSL